MSTSTETDEDLTSAADDVPRLLTRGVVDGFTEASEAFSHELEGTNRFPDLMGRSVAGVIRANARLLDELATVVRQMSDGLSVRSQAAADDEGVEEAFQAWQQAAEDLRSDLGVGQQFVTAGSEAASCPGPMFAGALSARSTTFAQSRAGT